MCGTHCLIGILMEFRCIIQTRHAYSIWDDITQNQQTMSTKKVLLGAVIGFATGAAIGVLMAPRSGKETRSIIKKKGKQAQSNLNEQLDKGYKKWKQVRNKVVDRANMTKHDIKDFLEFMSAEGSDLKDRITDEVRSTASDVSSASKRTADKIANN